MHIEVFSQSAGLHGDREIWVKVLSDRIVDWPDVQSRLSEQQEEAMKSAGTKPLRYFPHLVTKEEKAEHGHSFEDWWIFKDISVGIPTRSIL